MSGDVYGNCRNDGHAVEWTPFAGSTDLPGFVEHLSVRTSNWGCAARFAMETPVLYFYSPRDVTVSVRVAFSRESITEWYPHADRVQPSGILRNTSLRQWQADGSISWLGRSRFSKPEWRVPARGQRNRYYAAEKPLPQRCSSRQEQVTNKRNFLFYRGVSAAGLPLSAKLQADGKLGVKNLSQDDIPAIIFSSAAVKESGIVGGHPRKGNCAQPSGAQRRVDALCGDLEGILVDEGLYPDEATPWWKPGGTRGSKKVAA